MVRRRRSVTLIGVGRVAIGLALVAVLGGCGTSAFVCTASSECADGATAGVCQPDGFCSFPDDGCESGQRYGASSGAASGQCVAPSSADTGTTGLTASSDGPVTIDGSGSLATTVTADASSDLSTNPVDDASSGGGMTTDASSEATTEAPVLPEPLLWFSFDERGVDGIPNLGALGGAATCTGMACPDPIDGVVGDAAAFDGEVDCAVFPYADELALAGGLTVSAWVRREGSYYGFDGVLTKPVGAMPYNSWRLAVNGDDAGMDAVDFHVGLVDDTGGTIGVSLPDATWTHVVGTWDGRTMALWRDGMLVAVVGNALYEVDDQPVFLGCDDDHEVFGVTHHFHGMLDEVRLYDRALTDDEVALVFAGAG